MPDRELTPKQRQLVDRHRSWARKVVRQIAESLPHDIDFDDLARDGIIALAEAASHFDAARGAQFTRFAYDYIRGAVFDGLRARWDCDDD